MPSMEQMTSKVVDAASDIRHGGPKSGWEGRRQFSLKKNVTWARVLGSGRTNVNTSYKGEINAPSRRVRKWAGGHDTVGSKVYFMMGGNTGERDCGKEPKR